jgi:hypothetical protein
VNRPAQATKGFDNFRIQVVAVSMMVNQQVEAYLDDSGVLRVKQRQAQSGTAPFRTLLAWSQC